MFASSKQHICPEADFKSLSGLRIPPMQAIANVGVVGTGIGLRLLIQEGLLTQEGVPAAHAVIALPTVDGAGSGAENVIGSQTGVEAEKGIETGM
jgi:hypothetical protein